MSRNSLHVRPTVKFPTQIRLVLKKCHNGSILDQPRITIGLDFQSSVKSLHKLLLSVEVKNLKKHLRRGESKRSQNIMLYYSWHKVRQLWTQKTDGATKKYSVGLIWFNFFFKFDLPQMKNFKLWKENI